LSQRQIVFFEYKDMLLHASAHYPPRDVAKK